MYVISVTLTGYIFFLSITQTANKIIGTSRMAIAIVHPMLRSISGRIGSLVFYSYNGTQYVRQYVVPRNPDTSAQRRRRELFAEAVSRWQSISESAQERWNRKAMGTVRTGYTLFISVFLKGEELISEAVSAVSNSYHIKSLSVYASMAAGNAITPLYPGDFNSP
jgi:hypothetical protein